MWTERAMGLGVFATVAAVALVLVLPSTMPPAPIQSAITVAPVNENGYPDGASDTPLIAANLPVDAESYMWGVWEDEPIFLITLERNLLEIASRVYGRDTLATAMPHPLDPSLMVLAYQGKNTHLGCTHGFNHDLGADKVNRDLDGDGDNEGRILGPCHHEQYNVYNLGKHDTNTPGSGDLWMLELSVATDGTLVGTGPIGP